MPLVTYSLLRLGLFAVCLVLLWVAGMRGWLVVVAAALLAWGLSYVLLGRFRDAAAVQLAERAERRRALGGRERFGARAQEDADLEDALDEASRREDAHDEPRDRDAERRTDEG